MGFVNSFNKGTQRGPLLPRGSRKPLQDMEGLQVDHGLPESLQHGLVPQELQALLLFTNTHNARIRRAALAVELARE